MKLANLNTVEQARLVELENKIEQGKKTFVEVGLALCEIRDQRLYRTDHSTFEDYCRAKWNFTRQYANQIISGAAAVKSLPSGLETIVSNPGQALALAKVQPGQRADVLRTASASAQGRTMTAKDIQRAAGGRVRGPGRSQWSWWFNKTPEKRGWFLMQILSTTRKPIEVEDPDDFKKSIMKWLDESVRQKKST